jgi:PDZ domain
MAVAMGGAVMGCASPIAPATQTIRLRTPGCAMASCELSNDRGSWRLSRAPGSVTVTVSREPLKVSCRADDAPTTSAMARSARPATSGAGAVTGGVAGGAVAGAALGATALAFIPPLGVIAVLTGAGVGAAAGDATESHSRPLRYPELVSVPLSCSVADGGSTERGLKEAGLGLGIRGMTVAEAQAAGLGERTAVMVTSVVAEGRAAASGLLAGDVILAANGQDLGDAADLEERVLAMPQEVALALRVWRDRRTFDVMVARAP